MLAQSAHEIHELVFEYFADVRVRAGLVLLAIIQKLVFGSKLASEAFVLSDQIRSSFRLTVTMNFLQATKGSFLSKAQGLALSVEVLRCSRGIKRSCGDRAPRRLISGLHRAAIRSAGDCCSRVCGRKGKKSQE